MVHPNFWHTLKTTGFLPKNDLFDIQGHGGLPVAYRRRLAQKEVGMKMCQILGCPNFWDRNPLVCKWTSRFANEKKLKKIPTAESSYPPMEDPFPSAKLTYREDVDEARWTTARMKMYEKHNDAAKQLIKCREKLALLLGDVGSTNDAVATAASEFLARKNSFDAVESKYLEFEETFTWVYAAMYSDEYSQYADYLDEQGRVDDYDRKWKVEELYGVCVMTLRD